MKGTVVFDFDYTLADTARFKEALAASSDAQAVIERMPEFIFDGAAGILDRLKSDGWKLALLTVGDPGWQESKTSSSGILGYFDYVLYTAEPKTERVAEMLVWPGPLVFVNDHGGEIDALKMALPEAKMIGVRGPKQASSDSEVPLCDGLEEVYRIISGR